VTPDVPVVPDPMVAVSLSKLVITLFVTPEGRERFAVYPIVVASVVFVKEGNFTERLTGVTE
jgi:hypothetical protein